MRKSLIAAALPLLLVAACNNTTATTTPSTTSTATASQIKQIETDIANIASVVALDAPQIKQLVGGNATTITNAANAIQAAATAMAAQGPSASLVQTIGSSLNALLQAAQANPQLAQYSIDFTAAEVLVTGAETVLGALNLGAAPLPPPTSTQLDQARLELLTRLK